MGLRARPHTVDHGFETRDGNRSLHENPLAWEARQSEPCQPVSTAELQQLPCFLCMITNASYILRQQKTSIALRRKRAFLRTPPTCVLPGVIADLSVSKMRQGAHSKMHSDHACSQVSPSAVSQHFWLQRLGFKPSARGGATCTTRVLTTMFRKSLQLRALLHKLDCP